MVGFGARRLHDDDPIEAKYLNTPETPLYHKSQVLYGADIAKKEIARRRQAVVVEGYTDVMACHLAGVPTAVATCGTAFGPEHIGVLRRLLLDSDEFAGEMVFVFDGDEAGQRAALRAFTEDQRFVMQTFVAVEASGLDPCDLRLAKGDTAVRDLVARRQPAVAFALRAQLREFDLDTAEGRVRALDKTAPTVARIKDRALRPEYARRLAGELGMEVEPVLARVMELAGEGARGGGRRPAAAPGRRRPGGRGRAGGAQARRAGPAAGRAGLRRAGRDARSPSRRTRRSAGRWPRAGGVATARSGPEWVERIGEYCPDLVAKSTLTELAVERPRTSGAAGRAVRRQPAGPAARARRLPADQGAAVEAAAGQPDRGAGRARPAVRRAGRAGAVQPRAARAGDGGPVRLFRKPEKPPAEAVARLDQDERVVSWAPAPGGAVVATPLGLWLPGVPERMPWHLIDKATWRSGVLTS